MTLVLVPDRRAIWNEAVPETNALPHTMLQVMIHSPGDRVIVGPASTKVVATDVEAGVLSATKFVSPTNPAAIALPVVLPVSPEADTNPEEVPGTTTLGITEIQSVGKFAESIAATTVAEVPG